MEAALETALKLNAVHTESELSPQNGFGFPDSGMAVKGGDEPKESVIEMTPNPFPDTSNVTKTKRALIKRPQCLVNPNSAGKPSARQSLPTAKSHGLRVKVKDRHQITKSAQEIISPKPPKHSRKTEKGGSWLSKISPFET